MGDTEDLGLEFSGVFVHSESLAIVLAVVRKLVDENTDHTLVYYRYSDTWYLHKSNLAITSACFPSGDAVEMALLSADGIVTRLRKGNKSEEVIDSSDDGPSELVIMRHITEINGTQFAVGMARHAYRKTQGAAVWERIDATCFVPRAQRTRSVGFYSVDGFTDKDIYAVGYKGEIWSFDGVGWLQRPSPTNVVLTNVACDHELSRVVICGLAGTILVGRDDQWEELQQSETKADFWGMTHCDGKTFLSSDDGVFELKGKELERIEFPDGQSTTSFVGSAQGVVWSVGAKDIFRALLPANWERVPTP
jgi:hypothetical protein